MNKTHLSARSHLNAVLLMLMVTFLWSTSWVLIKIGLNASLPPVTLARYGYTLAFLCLLPVVLMNPTYRQMVQNFSISTWYQLEFLGLVIYTIIQGA